MLTPFSIRELSKQQTTFETIANIEQYIVYGSYSELSSITTISEQAHYLTEIVDSYLLRDILAVDGIKNAGLGIDCSLSVDLNISHFSGKKNEVSMRTYTGDSYFFNAGIGPVDFGYSQSFDGRWKTGSVGLGIGPLPGSVTFGCQRTY